MSAIQDSQIGGGFGEMNSVNCDYQFTRDIRRKMLLEIRGEAARNER